MTDASMNACVIHAFVRGTPGRRGDGGEVTMRTMTMRTTSSSSAAVAVASSSSSRRERRKMMTTTMRRRGSTSTSPRAMSSASVSEMTPEESTALCAALAEDLTHLFDARGIDAALYAPDVSFEDPLTKYDSFAGYAFNIQMLRRVFSPEYVMHDIYQSGPWEITTRWTMTMAVPAFPFVWRPRLTFTGTSIMGVDPETKRVRTHVDTWDSIENQRHLSPEGVAEVLKQIFDFTQTPDLDTPGYVVLKKRRDYEVRRYEPYLVASTGPGVDVKEMKTSAPAKMDGQVAGQAFNSLAGYIFGQANATGTKMEMTTPVFTKENTMQFVVSGDSVDALPASTNEKVVLQEEKGGIFVAKKFSGVATEDTAREAEAELRKCAARDGLETSGNAALAQYNDPFTNPLVRRNEIIIPVSNFTM